MRSNIFGYILLLLFVVVLAGFTAVSYRAALYLLAGMGIVLLLAILDLALPSLM